LTFHHKSHTLKLSRIGCGHINMAESEQTINLLPHEKENLMTQFLDWALSIGRLLVILTEIVALGTFIYRFGLDAQLVNLHDDIKTKSFIVDNFQSQEATYRDIQDRLQTAKQYTAVGKTTTGVFEEIAKIGQGKITFKDLDVSTDTMKIEVAAESGDAISQFVNALKESPSITSISVDKVANNTATAQITVYITATLKKEAFASTTTNTDSALNTATVNQQQ
jgi:Tfp pilus assembly protein PilN